MLWVLLLIKCLTFTLLSNVGHITHTCTQQHSASSVSPSLYREPLVVCTVVAAFCATDQRPRSYRSSNRGSDTTVGSLGELRRPSTSRLEQPHKQERHHTLTQNLKAVGLWVLLLIRCSTFTLSSDAGHITHTCTQAT
ncbi:hypothetical protein MtrunA17_Chr4g0004501 [Medicago truncatula]|nr:hypothetical protein MtrunA17_Chr4g0004501 [Medicago truncatula]